MAGASLKRLSEPSFIFSLPLVVLLAGILLVEMLHHLHQRHLLKTRQVDTMAFAVDLRSRAELELGSLLNMTSGLSSYLTVRHASLDASEMDNILRTTFFTAKHVRNLGVAVGYRLTYVYPVEGNEAAIGLDYRQQPLQWPAVERAVQRRAPELAEQVQLVQGGTAFIYREPVFIDGEFWGLLSTVIDSDDFLESTFGHITRTHMAFAVRGTSGKLLWGDEALFSHPDAQVMASERGWSYAVLSLQDSHAALLKVLRVLGWCLALALAFGVYSLLAHRRTLTYMALHDVVTGLPNRRLFNERLQQSFSLARKYRRPGPVVIFMDVDNFRAINDTHGHQAGDFVLNTLGQRLVFCAERGSTVARWAGDEFVLLFDQLNDPQLQGLLKRLQKAMAEPLYVQGRALQVSAAFGHARAFVDAQTPDDLVAAADRNMHQHPSINPPHQDHR